MPLDDVAAGKAIDDAYSRTGNAAPPRIDPQVAAGQAIDDAYSAQSTNAPPSRTLQYGVPQDPAAQRIRQAAIDAFQGNRDVLTPEAQNWLEQHTPGIVAAIPKLAGTVVGGVAAAGAAGVATVNELAREAGVNPQLLRDINMAAVAAPATAAVEGAPMRAGLANRPSAVAEAPPPSAAYTPMEARVAEVTGRRPGEAPGVEGAPPVNALDEKAAAAPAVSPTGIQARPTTPQPIPGSTGAAVPMTSEAARNVATVYYGTFDKAAQAGGSLAPSATNRFIASVEAAAPKPGIVAAAAGPNAISDLLERLQPFKDQSMSLEDAQGIDRHIGRLISGEYTRNPDLARELQGIQNNFRDQLSNPAPGDVIGGQAGLDALAPARKAYSQSMKMETLERIQQRANDTQTPTTSIQTQVRTLLNNDKLSRGFSDEEKAALRDAANRGYLGEALRIVSSRLTPIVAGGVGATGGFLGAVAAASTAHVLGEGARALENALAARRMQNAYRVLGKSVPPMPPNYLQQP